MNDRTGLRAGKLAPDLLRDLLGDGTDLPTEVQLGPALGEDACAIAVDAGTLVAATDPITLTGSEVGGHAVHINANDVAVMGVAPRWFLAAVMLPVGTREAAVRALFDGMRAVLREVGACLVGGHTEVTDAVTQPVVVGQMLGLATDAEVVATGGARPGDAIVQVGPTPVEGAAVLALEAAERLGSLSPTQRERARGAIRDPGISVVRPALLAARHGAHSLHDPTEGGLATGLAEIAAASGVRLVVREDEVAWFEPGVEVCRAVGADPWGTLASGALLAAFGPDDVAAALDALGAADFEAHVIGEASPGSGLVGSDGAALPVFARDEVSRVLEDIGRAAGNDPSRNRSR